MLGGFVGARLETNFTHDKTFIRAGPLHDGMKSVDGVLRHLSIPPLAFNQGDPFHAGAAVTSKDINRLSATPGELNDEWGLDFAAQLVEQLRDFVLEVLPVCYGVIFYKHFLEGDP